jgi:hypothetical protein
MYWRHWCAGCCFSTLIESCCGNQHVYTYCQRVYTYRQHFVHIPSTLGTRRRAMKVSREMVHGKLVSLSLILSLCHICIHKHCLHFQNLSPFNFFLLTTNSYIKRRHLFKSWHSK